MTTDPSKLTVATVLCALVAGALAASGGPKWLRIVLIAAAIVLVVVEEVVRRRRTKAISEPGRPAS